MNNNANFKCSYCICAYNEAENIGFLLERIREQKTHIVDIQEIIVVISGSTDDTVKIVNEQQKIDKRIKIIIQRERKGKALAINEALNIAQGDIIILESADTLIGHNAIDRLIKPFAIDEKIGMVGGHPFPVNFIKFNRQENFISYLGYLQWWFHDKISEKRPKMGELVSFRNIIKNIPEDTPVDETSIENLITKNGYKLFYSKRAYVFNKTPNTIRDFLIQRRRIHSGHECICHKYNYRVASYHIHILISIIVCEVKQRIFSLFKLLLSGKYSLFLRNLIKYLNRFVWLIGAFFLDAYAHLLGYLDYRIKRKLPFVWEVAKSTKKLITDKQKKNIRIRRMVC